MSVKNKKGFSSTSAPLYENCNDGHEEVNLQLQLAEEEAQVNL